MAFNLVLLLIGVFACATAPIMIQMSVTPPVLMAGLRMAVAVAVLSPLFVRDLARAGKSFARRDLRHALLPGAILALHFISWIIGARMTEAANCSLIVNMVPIAMPFFMFFMIREKITRPELAGTVLAVAGVVLLAAADKNVSAAHFQGDMICLISMLFLTYYLALSRKYRHVGSIWLYVVPVYAVGSAVCLLAAAVLPATVLPGGPVTWETFTTREVLLILGLGVIPTVVGHSTLNYCMRHMRGQVVSILSLFQFVFVGIMAYLIWRKLPIWALYPACALLITGAVIVLKHQPGADNTSPAPSTNTPPTPPGSAPGGTPGHDSPPTGSTPTRKCRGDEV